jgi:signal transduction histidine kinase
VLKEHTQQSPEAQTTLERRQIEVWPLIESVLHDLRPVAETASTELVNKVSRHLQLFADAEMLSRIFQNLITNSIRYTARGAVTIEGRELPGGRIVEFRVVDNGTGITSEFLPRVFDKFATDGEQDGSRGLGLSIVKKFVEAPGGTIAVESQEGAGTTITLRLPVLP